MKFIDLVKEKEIVNKANTLINSARTEVIATMLLEEEIAKPLPRIYCLLIEQKLRKGVIVKRLGFGKKRDFHRIVKKSPKKYDNFTFKHISETKSYQRMLIIDKKRALLGLSGNFYYTGFQPLVVALVKYFEIHYNKGKII